MSGEKGFSLRLTAAAVALLASLSFNAFASVTPTGNVFTQGGDPADDGPVLSTAGDLIVPDTDIILIDDLSALIIDGGSFVRAGGIANLFETVGDVTITGAGTRVELVQTSDARFQVNGVTSILDGAVLEASLETAGCVATACGLGVGTFGTADATLIVSGPGSTLNTAGGLVVGSANIGQIVGDATGTMIVDNGGVVNAERIGFSQGSENNNTVVSRAFVTIDGLGSAINTSGSIIIGNQFGNGAEAVVDIVNQGALNAGTVVLAGAGANADIQIDVNSGGQLTADSVFLARGLGADVDLVVDGAGSRLVVADDLVVGQGSNATLNATNGAVLEIGGGAPGAFLGASVSIGTQGGTGSLVLDGAQLIMTPNTDLQDTRLNIGLIGTGDALISNGSTVSITDLSGQTGVFGDGITVGQSQPGIASAGTLSIDGAGTSVLIDSNDVGFVIVGLAQDGTTAATGVVDVTNGASLTVNGRGGASGITLGRGANSSGSLNVSGVGTTIDILGAPGALLVGGDLGGAIGDGDASLTVTDGAVITIAGTTPAQGFLNVGLGTGNGVVDVDDNASINVDGQVNISTPTPDNSSQSGDVTISGSGSLNALDIVIGGGGQLSGDGQISAQTLTVGAGGSLSTDTIDGVDATFIEGGSFTVGAADLNLGSFVAQQLSVSEGGTVDVTGGAFFGGGSGGSADVTVTDSASSINVGGAVFVGDSLTLNDLGALNAVGNVTVGAGGLLSGDGGTLFAPQTFVNAGGTLGAGNSPGTLNIVGDVSLDGGVLEVEIAGNQPGEFDVLNIDGDLNLNSGEVSVVLLNGYNPGGQSFDVFSATGQIVLDPSVTFSGPAFEFLVRNAGGFDIGSIAFLSTDLALVAGLNEKQLDVARYMDDVCPRIGALVAPNGSEQDLNVRCNNLRNAANSPAQVGAAMDAIRPDEIIASFNTLFRFSGIQHGNLSRRLNGLRNGASRIDFSGLDVETENVSVSGEDLQRALEELSDDKFERWGFFSDGRFSFGDQDQNSRMPGFDFETISFTLGTDYRVSKNLFFGAALGYNEVNADFDAGGGVLIQGYSLSLLGTYFREESFYLDMLLTYGVSDVETSRTVAYTDVGGPVSRDADGDTDGSQFSAGVGSGFDFSSGRWVYGVHAGVNYLDVLIDDFNETGAMGLNMSIAETASRSLTANGGIHFSYTTTPSWGVLLPYARLDYVHEFKNDNEFEKVRFVNDRFAAGANPTQPLNVETGGADASYVIWAVGLHAQFIRGIAGFIDYRATAGLEDLDVSEVTLGLRFEKTF